MLRHFELIITAAKHEFSPLYNTRNKMHLSLTDDQINQIPFTNMVITVTLR